VFLYLLRSSSKPMVRLVSALRLADPDAPPGGPGEAVPAEAVEVLLAALENDRDTERLFGCLSWCDARDTTARHLILDRLCRLAPAAAPRALPTLLRRLRDPGPLGANADDFADALRLAFPAPVPSGCRADDLGEIQRELLRALVDSPRFWKVPRLVRCWPQGLPHSRQGVRRFLGQRVQPLAPEAALQVLDRTVQAEVARARAWRRVLAPAPRSAPGNMARTIREAVQHRVQALRITDEDRRVSDEDRRAVETLDLTGRATDEVLAHLGSLHGLRKLVLASSDVTDEGLRHLSAVPGLAELDLCDTAITGRGLSHLVHLTRLEELRLADTAVAAADLLRLAGLRLLREVSLTTGTRGDGLPAELREVLPRLRHVLPALRRLDGFPLPADAPREPTARERWDDLFKGS
jgi:hypothetical protein